MNRWIVAIALAALVAALILWQQERERAITACLASGGSWTGSACATGTGRTILQRDLHRS